LHPRLEIALILSDQYVDLVEERIDVALRVGRSTDSSLVRRRIGPMSMAFCAAPRYLAEHGAPKQPRDLQHHQVIRHLPRAEAIMTLRNGRRTVKLEPAGRLSCNDGATSVAAAVHGMGVFVGPEFEFAHEVRAGRLARVLVGWTTDVMILHAVSPPRRHVSSKVRTFVDFVGERWRKPPWSLAE
jgi:DNA-binding transcriptional LysR family regulator